MKIETLDTHIKITYWMYCVTIFRAWHPSLCPAGTGWTFLVLRGFLDGYIISLASSMSKFKVGGLGAGDGRCGQTAVTEPYSYTQMRSP